MIRTDGVYQAKTGEEILDDALAHLGLGKVDLLRQVAKEKHATVGVVKGKKPHPGCRACFAVLTLKRVAAA